MRSKLGKQSLVILGFAFLVLVGVLFWYRSQGVSHRSAGKTVIKPTKQVSEKNHTSKERSQSSDLPKVSPNDWGLILVNREHLTPELNPELEAVDNITVDKRIAENVRDFLKAAQEVDPAFHLISGYRSVAYQKELFQSYIDQEKAANPSLSEEEAEKLVKTYSQPGGASEHQTGLAIDLSTVDALNQADKSTMSEIHQMAPDYGFVLRFPDGKTDFTGVGYEDWHFRYVGKASARYMTDHGLTLEEYTEQLEERE
ncbi:M15 family metallopeptidase [Streptococcus pluranimalium]|uniref:D-alanyl-D-alanine carboxypeptidase n=1 Tax=Streptococcus pluranimalium TaxID=82348 RepID=A0A2L0D6U2_9STRE|nr:M15 family metallopeptidase [Streptococcus pluranimalium]AUW97309.1 D-alanyl-D-alanine carboxypeptidase [Streptococcus pluranimalium]